LLNDRLGKIDALLYTCKYKQVIRILINPVVISQTICLTLPHFIEVPLQSQESERSCMCVFSIP